MIVVHYSDATSRLGIILSLVGSEIRMAIQGQEDVAVYKFFSGAWVSESSEEVTFSFEPDLDDARRMMPHLEELKTLSRPSACAAAGDCIFRSLVRQQTN